MIAAKGHTLVYLTFTAADLDRDYVEVGKRLLTIEFDGSVYSYEDSEFKIGVQSVADGGWASMNTTNDLMEVDETKSYRCYVDIPVFLQGGRGAGLSPTKESG